MQKDFDNWNEKKKALERRSEKFLFKSGDIWWCSVGINIGSESCGKGVTFRRPVLVVRKLSSVSFIGIPLSTQPKIGSWFSSVLVNGVTQFVLLYQIRMFHVNRFQRRLATLENKDLIEIKQKLETLLEFPNNHRSLNSGSVGISQK
ncbi:MAG: type II toxin-antitoxin system PemK/MazF family toxin [Candidatus Doudnabacteria bacterium]|nr:type II toxin-antitoxin system PemK/MazF family toxin [Candidatus Doudnabacteria bacterium]